MILFFGNLEPKDWSRSHITGTNQDPSFSDYLVTGQSNVNALICTVLGASCFLVLSSKLLPSEVKLRTENDRILSQHCY